MATRLHIKEQPSLRWKREAEIAVDGVHYRLLRSLLTLGVIVLAVAFLTNILIESRLATACKAGVRAEAARQRELSLLASFTDNPLEPLDLAGRIAALPAGDWPLSALTGWLGLAPADLPRFQADCRAWRTAAAWLAARAPGHRRLLAGKRDDESVFRLLENETDRAAFVEAARRIPLRVPPDFLSFTARRRAFLAECDAVAARFNASQAAFRKAVGTRTLAAALIESPESLPASLALSPSHVQSLRTKALAREQESRLLARLRDPDLPVAWRARSGRLFTQDQTLEKLADNPAEAAWLLEQTRAEGETALPPPAAVSETARSLLAARRLTEAEDQLTANYGESEGLSAGLFWLLVVSFLVCMAGITNAMLLSVIERFREIATMKCLGALNGFIARLFLLEAAFLGLAGGVLGVILGGAIGIVRMSLSYGEWVARFFPWAGLGATAGIAAASGLVLAVLSALYPAWSAARMPPIEAMRVE